MGELAEPTDAQLVAAALAARNPEQRTKAFEPITARYHRAILQWCMWRLRDDPDGARDVAQTTFVDAFTKLARGEGPNEPDKLVQWLYGFARYRRLEYLRKTAGVRPGLSSGDESFDDLPDDEEARTGRASRAAHVQRLVDRVVATLEERDRLVFQLRFVQELSGRQIAERLGVSEKTGSNETTKVQRLVTDGFGALILAQEGRRFCPQLAQILDQAAFTGTEFTSELRARIVHHFDTCTTCDKCTVCADKRHQLVGPYAPVLLAILSAAALRERISQAIEQVADRLPPADDQPIPPSDEDPGMPGHPRRRRRRRIAIGAGAGLLVLIIVIVTLLLVRPGTPPLAAHVSSATSSRPTATRTQSVADTMPAIAYGSGNTLLLRKGSDPPRTLATLPAGNIVTELVWSWNGTYLGWMSGTAAGAATQIHVTDTGTGVTHDWACTAGCTTAAFQGEDLMAGTSQGNALTAYPVTGGAPLAVTVTGLTADPANPGLITPLGSTPHDAALVFFNAGSLLPGLDDELYTVTADGQATRIGTRTDLDGPGGDRTYAGAGMTAVSPDHEVIAYGGNRLGGDPCIGSERITVIDLSAGTQITTALPADTAQPLRISSVWIGTDHTVYAAAWNQPGNCPAGGGVVPAGSVTVHNFALHAGAWIDLGTATVQADAGPQGWSATLPGTVTIASASGSSIAPGTLTASLGSTHVDLGTLVNIFAWAPA